MQNKFSQHRIVAFACPAVFLSPCLAVSLSCCLCLRLPWPHVKVPAAALQCQQLLGNNNSSSRGTATTARVLHMSGIPSIPYSRHSPPPNTVCQLTIPIGSCNKSTRLLSSVFDSEIPSLVPDIFPSITQLLLLWLLLNLLRLELQYLSYFVLNL